MCYFIVSGVKYVVDKCVMQENEYLDFVNYF